MPEFNRILQAKKFRIRKSYITIDAERINRHWNSQYRACKKEKKFKRDGIDDQHYYIQRVRKIWRHEAR